MINCATTELTPQVFLEYAHAMTRLPELSQDSGASQDDAQVAELEELLRGVPKLIGLLPTIARDPMDARQSIAMATMITGLTRQLDKAAPTSLVSRWRTCLFRYCLAYFQSQKSKQLQGLPVDETAKLHHSCAIAHSYFLRTLDAI